MKRYKKVLLLVRDLDDANIKEIENLLASRYELQVQTLEYLASEKTLPVVEMFFLCMPDNDIKNFLKENKENEIEVTILPHPENGDALLHYGISKDIKKALEESFEEGLRLKDQMLLCNDELVFKKVSIGNVQNLNKQIFETSLYQNFKDFFINLRKLKYQVINIVTAKGKQIKTVASGVLVLEDYTLFSTLKSYENSSFRDGKLNTFIIAPYSVTSYLYYLLLIFLYHKFSIGTLPENIGLITSKSLKINSNQALDFSIDDMPMSAKNIEMEVYDSVLRINYGKSFQNAIEEENNENDDEKINIKNLPKGEIRELLVSGKIPLFQKASDEDIQDTLLQMRDSSKTTSIFLTLMILSTLLATVGVFQDSIPSVVGAMILAPLMAPIISLSMGAARSDRKMIKNSMLTLFIGIVSALLFSSILTIFMPLDVVTSQISSRINPNILDLFVAIFAGIAGAYASAKEEVAKSLAGVAIAVALVPPLCVTGIGLGWANLEIIYGSFLLFMTNLFGMVVSASLTFIILGFAPIHRAKKNLMYSSLMLSIICIPLVFSFYSLILQSSDYAKVQNIEDLPFGTIHVTNINSSTAKEVTIEAEVISKEILDNKEYFQLKQILEERMGKKVVLHVIPKIVIE
jgi:uncharacterized hydrophobic protein (TIGR00271 family)